MDRMEGQLPPYFPVPHGGPEKLNIALIGNPGVGKSAVLNTLLGAPVFRSGVSVGQGLTQKCATATRQGQTWIDTPGLDEFGHVAEAAQEISKALSRGGWYKIVFVCTLEEGRVRPADLATLKTVINALEKANTSMDQCYSVLINKCTPGEVEMLQVPREYAKIQLAFSSLKKVGHMDIFRLQNGMERRSDALLTNREELDAFFRRAPSVFLPWNESVFLDVYEHEKVKRDLERERSRMLRELAELEGIQRERNEPTSFISPRDVVKLALAITGRQIREEELTEERMKQEMIEMGLKVGTAVVHGLLGVEQSEGDVYQNIEFETDEEVD